MDLGESLNPAIDIGQIEGGFMQGYGLFVMEQLIHSPNGALLTKGKIFLWLVCFTEGVHWGEITFN